MYINYEYIWFIDEFYIWNNEKNGGIYSWFDKGKDDAYIKHDDEGQIKLGIVVAISNKGKCYYNIIRPLINLPLLIFYRNYFAKYSYLQIILATTGKK